MADAVLDSPDETVLRRFELYFNEQRADLTVFRVALQILMLRIAGSDRAEEIIATMKHDTLSALGRMPIGKEKPQGSRRAKELTTMRGELFFQELEESVSKVRNKLGQSGAN